MLSKNIVVFILFYFIFFKKNKLFFEFRIVLLGPQYPISFSYVLFVAIYSLLLAAGHRNDFQFDQDFQSYHRSKQIEPKRIIFSNNNNNNNNMGAKEEIRKNSCKGKVRKTS
jgi:hypothetical protein